MATAKDHAGTVAEQTIRSFEETLHQSVALQYAVANLLADLVTGAAFGATWQTKTKAIAGKVVQANQENTDEAIDYVDRGARSKRELVAKMLAPGGANPLDLWCTVMSTV